MNVRRLHRTLAWVLVLPLVIFLVTGAAFRVGRTLFGIDKETGNRILSVHVGTWLGEAGSTLYVVIAGCGVLAMIVAGFVLLFSRGGKARVRRAHRILGAVVLLPLTASAVTGVAYKAGTDWFNLPEQSLHVLMDIHQGSWLGPTLRVYYVIALAAGVLLTVGFGFTSLWRRRPARMARNVVS